MGILIANYPFQKLVLKNIRILKISLTRNRPCCWFILWIILSFHTHQTFNSYRILALSREFTLCVWFFRSLIFTANGLLPMLHGCKKSVGFGATTKAKIHQPHNTFTFYSPAVPSIGCLPFWDEDVITNYF
jgi:hypothetical protein